MEDDFAIQIKTSNQTYYNLTHTIKETVQKQSKYLKNG